MDCQNHYLLGSPSWKSLLMICCRHLPTRLSKRCLACLVLPWRDGLNNPHNGDQASLCQEEGSLVPKLMRRWLVHLKLSSLVNSQAYHMVDALTRCPLLKGISNMVCHSNPLLTSSNQRLVLCLEDASLLSTNRVKVVSLEGRVCQVLGSFSLGRVSSHGPSREMSDGLDSSSNSSLGSSKEVHTISRGSMVAGVGSSRSRSGLVRVVRKILA